MIGEAPICLNCPWYNFGDTEGITCRAFPKGIPEDILEGGTHDEIRDDQEGRFIFDGMM